MKVVLALALVVGLAAALPDNCAWGEASAAEKFYPDRFPPVKETSGSMDKCQAECAGMYPECKSVVLKEDGSCQLFKEDRYEDPIKVEGEPTSQYAEIVCENGESVHLSVACNALWGFRHSNECYFPSIVR